MSRRLLAIYRSATYSPGRHRSNDAAIMDATTALLARAGWGIERLGENDVEAGILPSADLYLNMCQGSEASELLRELERDGVTMINRASGVLHCHRHRLVRILTRAGTPFPTTVIISPQDTAEAIAPLRSELLWVKRGDVHAQEAADVVCTERGDLATVLAGFAGRGITRVAIQEHLPGAVVKFYGVAHADFFQVISEDGRPLKSSDPELRALRPVAMAAARAVGLSVFGGDAVLASGQSPVLIDLNDWPSFAPVRDQAAAAIAKLVETATMQRSTR